MKKLLKMMFVMPLCEKATDPSDAGSNGGGADGKTPDLAAKVAELKAQRFYYIKHTPGRLLRGVFSICKD